MSNQPPSTSNDISTYDLIRTNHLDPSHIDPDYLLVLLREAVSSKDTPFVRAIFDTRPELLTIDDGGASTLWRALRNDDNIEIATMLVSAGVDLSRRHPNGSSVLHWVIKWIGEVKGAERLVQLMIENGADVNARDVVGRTVLSMAVDIHARSVVETLLKYDADVEDDDVYRAAFGYRTAEMLPMLLAGGDVDTRKRRARTALWCYLCCQPLEEFGAEVFDLDKPSDYYKDLSLIRRIVQYALFPGQSDVDAIHVLAPAVRLGHLETVKLILEYHVELHNQRQYAAQLFCFASRLQKPSIARLLIERGANINSPNDLDEGQYPLHEACRNSSIQNIHLFLRLGADINVTDRNGKTPFSLINADSFTHHHQLFIKHIAVLIIKGCKVNDSDLNLIRDHPRMHAYYEECTLQLSEMKKTDICDGIKFFCFFDTSLEELTDYVKRADFVERYRTCRQERRRLFPLYCMQMDNIFQIAEKRKNFLIIREKFYGEPSSNIAKIDLEYVEKDFYFLLHERITKGEPGYDINLLR